MIGIYKQAQFYQKKADMLNHHIKGMKAINTLPKLEMTAVKVGLVVKTFQDTMELQPSVLISARIHQLILMKILQSKTTIKNYLS